MKNYFIISFLSLFIFAQCKQENPFVSKEVIDKIEAEKNPLIGNISFIFNNDIYYLKNIKASPKQLTFSPSLEKTEVKINHKGDKIAYLNKNSIPVIIDTIGNIISTLSHFSEVKKMDWSFDDETLYMLIGNEIKFYGPPMDIPSISYPGIPVNISPTLEFIAISNNNDIAYSYTTFDYLNGTVYRVIFKKKDNLDKAEELVKIKDNKIKHLQFVNKTNDLIIGYDYFTYSREVTKVEVYPYLQKYPSSIFESSQKYIDPIYRADLQYMVSARKDLNSDHYTIAANRFFQDNKGDYYFNNYSTSQFPFNIYVNWK